MNDAMYLRNMMVAPPHESKLISSLSQDQKFHRSRCTFSSILLYQNNGASQKHAPVVAHARNTIVDPRDGKIHVDSRKASVTWLRRGKRRRSTRSIGSESIKIQPMKGKKWDVPLPNDQQGDLSRHTRSNTRLQTM